MTNICISPYSYSRVAYCDVMGRESRLPLRITGQGIGPRLMFSFDTLNIQNVFINSAHAYEVYTGITLPILYLQSKVHTVYISLSGDSGEQGRHRCKLHPGPTKFFVWSFLHLLPLKWPSTTWYSAVHSGYPTPTPNTILYVRMQPYRVMVMYNVYIKRLSKGCSTSPCTCPCVSASQPLQENY